MMARQEKPRDAIEKLGRRIRELRKAIGLTQAELAERTGISVNFIGTAERGVYSRSVKTLARIADALGLQLSELFNFPDVEKVSPEREYALKDLFNLVRDGDPESIRMVTDLAKTILKRAEPRPGS